MTAAFYGTNETHHSLDRFLREIDSMYEEHVCTVDHLTLLTEVNKVERLLVHQNAKTESVSTFFF